MYYNSIKVIYLMVSNSLLPPTDAIAAGRIMWFLTSAVTAL